MSETLPKGIERTATGKLRLAAMYRGQRIHKSVDLLSRKRNPTVEDAAQCLEQFKQKIDRDSGIQNERIFPGFSVSGGLWESAEAWAVPLHQSAKKRANRKKRACTITVEDISRLLNESRGFCDVTGIKLNSHDRTTAGNGKAFNPSIDRINSNKGYTPKNCRIVCLSVNMALNKYGDDVFDYMCRHYVANNMIIPRTEPLYER